MYSIFQPLVTIARVLFRKSLSNKEKSRLIAHYYLASLRRKLTSGAEMRFLGLKIYARAYDNLRAIIREVFLFGDYEVRLQSSEPVIFDCGGNIGVSTLYFKYYYPRSKITVFEPSKENFETLEKNVKANALKNVTVVNAALGKENGTMRFWDNPTKPGASTSVEEVYETKVKQNFVEVTVPSVRLSEYILGPIDLLKMDIEGGEGGVMEDLDESGKIKEIKEMVFEYHHNKKNAHNELLSLLKILEKNSFKYVIFGNEFALSSEQLKSWDGYHFMIRAFQEKV